MKISVIVVHWNTPSVLEAQLKHLKPSKDLEVIVVDNASKESSTLSRILKQSKQVVFMRNKKNMGFATACNQGADNAKGEWLLFLNPDTHITSDEVLKFTNNAEKKNLDAASPEQVGEDYFKPLPTWLSLLIEFSPLKRFIPLSLFNKHTLFGGCLLIRAAVLKNLNGWDEDFFLWFEDSDLTQRLYDNGYKVGWLPVKYSHAGGSSFAKLDQTYKKKLFFSSMKSYAQKHFGMIGKLVVRLLIAHNTRK